MMIDFVSNSFSGNTAYGLLRWEGRGGEGRGEGGGGKGEGKGTNFERQHGWQLSHIII